MTKESEPQNITPLPTELNTIERNVKRSKNSQKRKKTMGLPDPDNPQIIKLVSTYTSTWMDQEIGVENMDTLNREIARDIQQALRNSIPQTKNQE